MSGSVFLRYRVVVVVLVHAVLVAGAWFGAWWLRLDDQFLTPQGPAGFDYGARALSLSVWVVVARLACLAYFGLFQGLWRYVSVTDLVNLGKATAAGSVLYCALLAVQRFENVPRSVVILEPILCVTGDTQIELFLREPLVRRSRVLVYEVTGWDERRTPADVRIWGHTHVEEMIACCEAFEGDALVLVHRSPRHSRQQAEGIVRDRFPAAVRSKVHVFGP